MWADRVECADVGIGCVDDGTNNGWLLTSSSRPLCCLVGSGSANDCCCCCDKCRGRYVVDVVLRGEETLSYQRPEKSSDLCDCLSVWLVGCGLSRLLCFGFCDSRAREPPTFASSTTNQPHTLMIGGGRSG